MAEQIEPPHDASTVCPVQALTLHELADRLDAVKHTTEAAAVLDLVESLALAWEAPVVAVLAKLVRCIESQHAAAREAWACLRSVPEVDDSAGRAALERAMAALASVGGGAQ